MQPAEALNDVKAPVVERKSPARIAHLEAQGRAEPTSRGDQLR